MATQNPSLYPQNQSLSIHLARNQMPRDSLYPLLGLRLARKASPGLQIRSNQYQPMIPVALLSDLVLKALLLHVAYIARGTGLGTRLPASQLRISPQVPFLLPTT